MYGFAFRGVTAQAARHGWINVWLGQPELALEHLGRAGRLDPGSISHFSAVAHAYFFLDRHEEALAVAEQMVRYNPQLHSGLRIGTASAAFAGHRDTARMLAARLQAIDPAFRVSRLNEYLGPYQQSAFVEKYARRPPSRGTARMKLPATTLPMSASGTFRTWRMSDLSPLTASKQT